MFTVRVPATTANLGPGFDCLGLALEFYNEVDVEPGGTGWTIEGVGQDDLVRGDDNLLAKAFHEVLTDRGAAVPSLRVVQRNRIPLSRGLGSSASAIVAGVLAANRLLDSTLTQHQMVQYATRLEGHPDNVAPALVGGLVLCRQDDTQVTTTPLPFPAGVSVAVAIPEVRVSTEGARRALPSSYPLGDVTFTVSRACLLIASLLTGDLTHLDAAVEDRIHTPYRSTLIPGFDNVRRAARDAGALACFISGSGPTMAAFTHTATGPAVARAMQTAFEQAGLAATSHTLPIDTRGAHILT